MEPRKKPGGPPLATGIPKSSTTGFGSVRLGDLLNRESLLEEHNQDDNGKWRGSLEKSQSVDDKDEHVVEGVATESAVHMAADSLDLDDRLKAGMDRLKLLAHKGKEEIKERLKKRESNKYDSDKGDVLPEASVKLSNLTKTTAIPLPEKPIADNAIEIGTEPAAVIEIDSGNLKASTPVAPIPSRKEVLENVEGQDKECAQTTLLPSKFWMYAISSAVGLVCILPFLPTFLSGFVWGVALSWGVAYLLYWIFAPRVAKSKFTIDPTAQSTESCNLGRIIFKSEIEAQSDVVFRGWMNALPDGKNYRPNEYSVNKTISVLLRLDGSTLRISKPIHNVLRHACWQDPTLRDKDPRYVGQNLFDLTDAKVCLRPRRLARGRFWSRKYPICIKLKLAHNANNAVENADLLKAESESKLHNISSADNINLFDPDSGAVLCDRLEDMDSTDTDQSDTISVSSKRKKKCRNKFLYLFARTSREKEMWFHRLRQSACMYSFRKEQSLSPPRNVFVHDDIVVDDTSDTNQVGPTRTGSMRIIGQRPRLHSSDSAKSAPMIKKDESLPQLSDTTPLFEPGEGGWSCFEDDARELKSGLSTNWMEYATTQMNFSNYMSRIFGPEKNQSTYVNVGSTKVQILDLGSCRWNAQRLKKPIADSTAVSWANAMAARIFYDFTGDAKWIDFVQCRIQSKLSTIRLPHFIETLHLTRLEPGSDPPKITGAFEHTVNEWGLWVDFKVDYSGGFTLTLETKVNLMKLKHGTGPNNMAFDSDSILSPSTSDSDFGSFHHSEHIGSYSDENIPESPESSPDEDSGFIAHIPLLKADSSQPKESKGKKILNFVDKLSSSKVFQEVTDTKFVKKVMQGISDTPLMLKVEVVSLSGVVAINVAPPPSDRIWYAFRSPPNVQLKVSPKVGEKVIGMTHVTEWIGNKLKQLIEKNLVLPNMDDFMIPVMGGSPLLHHLNQ